MTQATLKRGIARWTVQHSAPPRAARASEPPPRPGNSVCRVVQVDGVAVVSAVANDECRPALIELDREGYRLQLGALTITQVQRTLDRAASEQPVPLQQAHVEHRVAILDANLGRPSPMPTATKSAHADCPMI